MKDIYVKFGKPLNGKEIKGESRDSGTGTTHKAPWFEVTSWTHFIRQPKSATASTAGGHTAERTEHGEMLFTKDIDKATSKLFRASSAGTVTPCASILAPFALARVVAVARAPAMR